MNSTVITIYQNNNSRGHANNPNGFTTEFNISNGDTDTLAKAVQYDNCPGLYKNGYRKSENFIKANCILADIDNTHSENPSDWITHDDVINALPNVSFYYYPSRNHLKEKNGQAPRPKEHYIFPTYTIHDVHTYTNTMKTLIRMFPQLHFDTAVSNGAQLNFGVENPTVSYVNGTIDLSEFIKQHNNSDVNTESNMDIIPQGNRNNTMFKYALKILSEYGDSDVSQSAYMRESQKCNPPLDDSELSSIWNSALSYYKKDIQTGYDYNEYSTNWTISPKDPIAVQALYKPEKKYRKFNIATAKLILKALDISIKLNDMNRHIEVFGLPDKYSKDDAYNILVTIISDIANDMSYKRATSSVVQETLNVIANENHYHPVLSLLYEEKWDNIDRLNEIYNMLGINDSFYKVFVKKWAIQTIALLFNSESNPITAEGVLVLQGKQGVGKTQFFSHLAIKENFFKGGATLDMSNKDSLMSATKIWICELGEIDSTTKKEQSALKAFLTEKTDRFREPYARCETIRPRRTSFCGTVNPKGYLRDETGNRRYWTIPIEKINLKKIFEYDQEWYAQFWRQILVVYQNNPTGYLLTAEEKDFLSKNNVDYELDVFGQDEFMTTFNLSAQRTEWTYKTAAQIANILSEKFKNLKITSVQVGKILNQIEQRENIQFERKIIQGKRLILCPPISKNGNGIQSTPVVPYVPLAEPFVPNNTGLNLYENSNDIVNF